LSRLPGSHPDPQARRRCSECGLHAEGGHRKLCACGVKLRTGKNAGLRCVRNPDIRPEAPAEIIVVHQDEEAAA